MASIAPANASIRGSMGLPVRGITEGEASAHFDRLTFAVPVDNPTSSAVTRDAAGWRPREVGLLTCMRDGGYFS